MNKQHKEALWEKQSQALRDPIALLAQSPDVSGIEAACLTYTLEGEFEQLLAKLRITLFLTREYEHLALALTTQDDKFRQSFIHLAHPSGLTVDRHKNAVYIAATRNPNQIWQFQPTSSLRNRIDSKTDAIDAPYLMPVQTKYLAGAFYVHDLAVIGDDVYANSVGQNGIVKVAFGSSADDTIIWWPRSIEDLNGLPNTTANFLQLNSIAAGRTLEESYFSASSAQPGQYRPGDLEYPVDKQGVIFSGKTRDVLASGLTRPHSARLYDGKIWVDNSGYGEVGYIERSTFKALTKLPGWTRGLCMKDTVLFVGVSRVLPRFKVYAPGLSVDDQLCGIYALDIKTGEILGAIKWPYGNQIFAIDWIDATVTPGFIYTDLTTDDKDIVDFYYRYKI